MKFGESIAFSGKRCLAYTESLLKGISADQFARFPQCGGKIVETNHPSFILGHLSFYGYKVAEELGYPSKAADFEESYKEVYSHKTTCKDDPDGSIYPEMALVVERFFDSYQAGLKALQSSDDAKFDLPNPMAAAIDRFPTIGSMHAFYIGGHMMMHLGQLSAWRRIMGMGAA